MLRDSGGGSSVGRASASQAEGREFEPRPPLYGRTPGCAEGRGSCGGIEALGHGGRLQAVAVRSLGIGRRAGAARSARYPGRAGARAPCVPTLWMPQSPSRSKAIAVATFSPSRRASRTWYSAGSAWARKSGALRGCAGTPTSPGVRARLGPGQADLVEGRTPSRGSWCRACRPRRHGESKRASLHRSRAPMRRAASRRAALYHAPWRRAHRRARSPPAIRAGSRALLNTSRSGPSGRRRWRRPGNRHPAPLAPRAETASQEASSVRPRRRSTPPPRSVVHQVGVVGSQDR